MAEHLRATNDQAAVECAGFAVDDEMLVLLDVVGHKTACKSIWASAVNSPRRTFHLTDERGASLRVNGGDAGVTQYRAFWQELPEQGAHNLLICHAQVLAPAANPRTPEPFYVVDAGGTGAAPPERCVALLNQALDLPLLAAWSARLWQAGAEAELVRAIACGGDVRGAWRVWPDGDRWSALVQSGLQAGALTM